MRTTILRTVAIVLAMLATNAAEARTLQPQRVDIRYVAPKTAKLETIYELSKKVRVLEKVRDLLKPLRLPRRLLLKTEDCDGELNAWYDGEAVTVCYEFLDD